MRLSLQIPPGVIKDDTPTTVGAGAWVNADHVRFWRSQPEVIGGWERLTTDTITGKCRGLFSWRDNDDTLNVAIGTHSKLYVSLGGDFYDLTPAAFVAGNEDATGGLGYGTGAYSTGAYSAPATTDFWPLSWAFGSFGQNLMANPRGQTIWQWENDGTVLPTSLGRSSIHDSDFTGYADQTAFDAVWTRGTGWTFDAANDEVDCDGSQVSASDLTRDIATTSGKWHLLTVTFEDRTAGAIAALAAGVAGASSSLASGTVSTTFKATSVTTTIGAQADADWIGSVTDFVCHELNAPDEVTYMTVTPERQVMAYGCNEEATNTFNPRVIRYCDFANPNDWVTTATNNAGEEVLDGSGALVAARETAYGAFVWTTNELYFRQYVGDPAQTYRFQRIGSNCGLMGPNAAVVLGNVAYWMSRDAQTWVCTVGGEPQRLLSPFQSEIADNIEQTQQSKTFAGSISQFNEIWWFYPDERDGTECSRAFAYQINDGAWSGLHTIDRTAFIDAGPGLFPIGVDASSKAYYHERGRNADGSAIDWSLESGDITLNDANNVVMLRELWPNVQDQWGNVDLDIRTKKWPQDDETTAVSLTMTPGEDREQFIASGRYLSLLFSGSSAPAAARIGPINVELTTRGRR